MYLKDYPFIRFAVGFVIGIIGFSLFQPGLTALLIILSVSVLLIFLAKKNSILNSKNFNNFSIPVISICLGMIISNLHSSDYNSPLSVYQKEKESKLFGSVINVELKKSFEIVFTVTTDSIFIGSKKYVLSDKLICKFRGDSLQRFNLYNSLYPGNKIFVSGTFHKGRERRNPGEFDYNAYLKSKGITGLFISYDTDSIKILEAKTDFFSSLILQTRKEIDETIQNLHSPQTAGLLRGLILADRSEIDFETKNEFINSGVIHILAVSGLHVGYVLIIFIFLFGRFNIYVRSLLTILGLLAFMFLTGAPPSVIRATLMAMIIIIAFLTNRSTNIINSIAIAGVVILLLNPDELYNPGFQLSFSAVLAIGIIYPKIQRFVYKLKISRKWLEGILLFCAVSLSAQIGTLPFTLAYFSKLSLVALFTNLLVIPAVGIIIAIAFMTIFISLFFSSIAFYFAVTNNFISDLMISLIKFAGRFDFSFLWIRDYSLYDSIVFYLFLAMLMYSLPRLRQNWLKIIISLVIASLIFLYSSFDDKKLLKNNKLNLLMIDVGQGDSFLIKFPNGKTALIDAGEANPFVDNGERVIMPLLDYLGINKIDYGFISHLDLDHYGGFVSLILKERISHIYRPMPDTSQKSIRLEKFLKDMKIKTSIYDRTKLEIGNSVVYFLNEPTDPIYFGFSSNDKSGVMKIVYGNASFLFVGDCEYQAEYFLAKNFFEMLDSDVLKVGHHGSPTGSTKPFLKLVSPEISLVSAGIKNKFDHPAQVVLDNLESLNSKIYRTDIEGAVLLQSDGNAVNKIYIKN